MVLQVPKIEVSQKFLGTLMSDISQGSIRIPRFQREFVWKRSDILKLLDSMLKEFPIGTVFLWNAPAEYNHILRDIKELDQPLVAHNQRYQIVLDGQQRLTSLYAVINALQIGSNDFGKVVVDLDNGEPSTFLYRQPDNQRYVSLKNVLSGAAYELYDNLETERRSKFRFVGEVLTNYPSSVVTVSVDNIRDAVKIFERINQRGKRLRRYDLICAGVWSNDFDLRLRSNEDINDKLSNGFGKIPEARIPQALALITKDSALERMQFSLTTEDVSSVWDKTVKGFQLAIDFVRENLGVTRSDFLPYDAFLPVLVKYYFETGLHGISSTEHQRQLEYWFWRSTFSQRYGSAVDTRITEDARWVRQLIEVNAPYRKLPVEDLDLPRTIMSKTSAIARGILCILNVRQPLHFSSKAKVNLATDHFSKFTSAERHHIFPAGLLSKKGFKWGQVHSVANFCFIPADLNKWISDRPPSDYMSQIRDQYDDVTEFQRVMSTHLIPVNEDSGIWTDDYELFLGQRSSLLMDEIRRRCGIGSRIDSQEQDSVVNRLEVALRDKIHETLLVHDTGYWKHRIPGEIRMQVKDRIAREDKNSPGKSGISYGDARAKLDFCDVSDYAVIITRKDNWQYFAPVFNIRDECRRMLMDFSEFRAVVKHNREISPILEHKAHAAILWLSDAIKLDLRDFGL